jgi:hypothetical protein
LPCSAKAAGISSFKVPRFYLKDPNLRARTKGFGLSLARAREARAFRRVVGANLFKVVVINPLACFGNLLA